MAAEAIRYMLTRRQPFTPAGATTPLGASRPLPDMRDRRETPIEPDHPKTTR
jgi:hypothetical protein